MAALNLAKAGILQRLQAYADNSVESWHGEAGVAFILPNAAACASYFLEGGGDDEICSNVVRFIRVRCLRSKVQAKLEASD